MEARDQRRQGTNQQSPSVRGSRWIDVRLLTNPQLWSLVPADVREKTLKNSAADSAPLIDLNALGYAKLLGKGRLPAAPIVVRARYVSKEAEKKITDAGGVVELVA